MAGLPFLCPPSAAVRLRRGGSHRRSGARTAFLLAALGVVLLVLAPIIAHAQSRDSVTVAWTAPGDDASIGTATAYDFRISLAPIDAGSFEAAQRVDAVPAPSRAGTRQSFVIRGLDRGTIYFIALRTQDDAGNWSSVSNVVRWDWIVDHAPPSPPRGPKAKKEAGAVSVSWPPSAESDLQGYNVYRAVSSNGTYTRVNADLVLASEFVDTHPPAEASALWYQVSAVDASGNESARSATIAVELEPSAAEWIIEAAYPNPSRAAAAVQIPVSVPLTASGNLVIDVLDSGNRLVRRLEAPGAPGPQRVTWDGKNDAGRVVAPGVYRACLRSGGSKLSVRLLRVP